MQNKNAPATGKENGMTSTASYSLTQDRGRYLDRTPADRVITPETYVRAANPHLLRNLAIIVVLANILSQLLWAGHDFFGGLLVLFLAAFAAFVYLCTCRTTEVRVQ